MFVGAYASMRVIDDFVDDDFTLRPPAERAGERARAHGRVDGWLAACRAALSGAPEEAPEFLDPRIGRALAAGFGGADLGPGPWDALATAMHRDVDELAFRTWEDFTGYCEGATVAPASIFLYVLAGRFSSDGSEVRSGLPAEAAACARDMAVFCYLVHIARDLLKDARASTGLITIPDEALTPHGLDRSSVASVALSADTQPLRGLVRDLVERAGHYRARADGWLDRIRPALALREAASLHAILAVYHRLHDRITADPSLPLSGDPEERERLRRDALSAAGIGL